MEKDGTIAEGNTRENPSTEVQKTDSETADGDDLIMKIVEKRASGLDASTSAKSTQATSTGDNPSTEVQKTVSETADGDDLIMKIVEKRASGLDASTSTKTTQATSTGDNPTDLQYDRDVSEATDVDDLIINIVEQRASGTLTKTTEDEGKPEFVHPKECLASHWQEAEERLSSAYETDEVEDNPLVLFEAGLDAPALERQPNMREESAPGAFHMPGTNWSTDDDRVSGDPEATPEDNPTSTPTTYPPTPALDARLVDETMTAPTARVSRARLNQGREELPPDEEQALPRAIEEVKSTQEEKKQDKPLMRVGGVCVSLMLVIIVLLVLGITGVLSGATGSSTNEESSDVTKSLKGMGGNESSEFTNNLAGMTTLQRINATGQLRCADIFLTNGFMYHDRRDGDKTGFYGELCHALAAALNAKAVFSEPVIKWGYLQQVADHDQNETVDVAIIGHTITMERVVKGALEGVKEGLSFTTPMLYGGLKLGGDHFHITHCVDQGMKHLAECDSIRVCIHNMTRSRYNAISALMPTRFFVQSTADDNQNFAGLLDGSCNVVVQGMFQNSYPNAVKHGVTNYSVSEGFYSKEPMAMVTKSNDPEFSDFVKSVLQALLVAEQHNITQATASSFPQTDLFGPYYKDAFRNALREVGNYGELYSRFLDEYIPRSGLNLLNDGTTGLLYSLPWGKLDVDREGRPLGSIMQSVLDRGMLRCGIRIGRPGFAENQGGTLFGMDIDLCMAMAAGLFGGNTEAVEFVEVEDSSEGFVKLAEKEIDVLTAALWSIVNDVKDPTTGMGFAFSQPYFYGFSEDEDNFALATMQDDHDWLSYVFWTIVTLINAEENNIHSNNSVAMPEQHLFGPDLKRMLRDIVWSMGNYGDLYAKNLESIHPRQGRNMLNVIPDVGPQFYPLPGFFD